MVKKVSERIFGEIFSLISNEGISWRNLKWIPDETRGGRILGNSKRIFLKTLKGFLEKSFNGVLGGISARISESNDARIPEEWR